MLALRRYQLNIEVDMDAKAAIVTAKQHFSDMYSGENVTNVGLEEVRFDEQNSDWLITLGFSWTWDQMPSIASVTGRSINTTRFYKVVRIKNFDGELVSVTNRNPASE